MAGKKMALLLSVAAWTTTFSGGNFIVKMAGAAETETAASRDDYPSQAPRLVEQALAAGVTGNVDERAALLKRASAADGDFAPARWQQGQVKFDGKWRTPAEVAEHVAADERWKEYESLRSEAGETAEGHQELAKYCMRHQLTAEERYHWANVILALPSHAQARQRLGLQEFQGGLFTREQVAAEKERREQAERDLARFKPKFAAWCREATSDVKATRDGALAKISAIDEVAAIPALRNATARVLDTADGKRHRAELVLAMTAALAKMPQHEATLNLLELAVFSNVPEVRQKAAEALKPRPTTDYVPLLMAAMEAPIEAEVDVVTAPDGTVRMVETVTQQQPLRKVAEVRSTDFEVAGAFGRDRAKTNMGAVLNRHLRSATSRAGMTQSRVASANAVADERNQRIQQVLKITLGAEAAPEEVTAWWEAWKNYNELEYDSSVTDYQATFNDTFTHAYEQAPRVSANRVGERAAGSGQRTGEPAQAFVGIGEPGPRFGGGIMPECFAAGTLVWKQSGPTPIEQIRIGDMVLAKHPTTGELGYRPVIETSFSSAAPVVSVKFTGDEFIATRGHRFWVEGTGWLMAKELPKTGSLHALNGGLAIEAVEPSGDVDCYNLVVDDFHTFVVGKSQVLVHDKTCPQPTIAVTPGLANPKIKRETARVVTEFVSAAAE